MSGMTGMEKTNENEANVLCKSCGLCCTGHLFIWTKLRSAELDSIESLGVPVLRSDPRQRGFDQPCPLWEGQCTIYTAPHYPRFCQTYKCQLLKSMLDEQTSLVDGLATVANTKRMIREIQALLPASANPNFRERVEAQLQEPTHANPEFQQKAEALLAVYKEVFGVEDVIE